MIETIFTVYLFGAAMVSSVGVVAANNINDEYIAGLIIGTILWPVVFFNALVRY